MLEPLFPYFISFVYAYTDLKKVEIIWRKIENVPFVLSCLILSSGVDAGGGLVGMCPPRP